MQNFPRRSRICQQVGNYPLLRSIASSWSLSKLPSQWGASSNIKSIDRSHIIPMVEYEEIRKDLLKNLRVPLLRRRRVNIGPDASFLFTNFDTIWFQIHEMLRIEKGGENQIGEEIEAYKSLIPNRNLVGAFMVEINDKERRGRLLRSLVGIEGTLSVTFSGEIVAGKPIVADDVDREKDGKTSAVHFVEFSFSEAQRARLLTLGEGESIFLCSSHPHYNYISKISTDLTLELKQDMA